MSDTNPLHLDLVGVAEAIAGRQVSSVEVTRACLEAADRLQSPLNLYIRIDGDEALAAAAQADAAIARGDRLGPLHGVPLAHKDMYYRAGRVVTCGSQIRRNWVADTTATALDRLSAAGALNLGTLNMAEFAMGGTGHNYHFGHCRNPWNVDHVPGGSSSGSGAGVAARLFYGALGSDTGGSIRLPAAFCGVTGIKPTQTRVSRYGAMPLSFSMDNVGPLARSARDCARLLGIIAGADPRDPTASTLPVPDYEAGIGSGVAGLTIAVPTSHYLDNLHADVLAAYEAATQLFERMGARLVEVAVPDHDQMLAAIHAVIAVEAAAIHGPWLRKRPGEYSQAVRSRIEPGLYYPATRYLEALNLRSTILAAFNAAVFDKADAMLTPVLATPVPTLAATDAHSNPDGSRAAAAVARNTRPINYLGLPALAFPGGFSSNGLPIGLQLVGRAFDEATLLRMGHAYQQETRWHERLPPLAAGTE
ncbi:aspartyl/glutamyl-tRNA(Asn/Gln) amidotransferase subunit A [Stella humosa]|uniref:Aspartyl/glutamyl-tRNA(Asn/Gln) amidotransferase subunit A n=1 Tax=Stella humosa TaxID=94 RepID=A0A3N1LNG5_9PROT|nr:amidase [Stella humosa]ROP90765.1 aspartyl/glutamyl-tRNA(Asn/Gln) amidotransferase subunit A [Stella humosa]BBK34889.1 amidase [Stella humosa]